jgi:phosphatidylethanolamine/phosphatidyl-N-methylethanolamine N-methyltransferase
MEAKKIFDRVAPLYDYIEFIPEIVAFSRWRKILWSMVDGQRILELGIGTGKNVPYFPEGKVYGCDISWNMLKVARNKKDIDLSSVPLAIMDVEDLAYRDNSFDTVVGSFIICSVDHPLKSFKEIQRICKPGGKVLFMENVRSKHKITGLIMDAVNAITSRIKGAHITRPTLDNIKKSDLEVIELIPLFLDISWIIVCRNPE